jgi:glucosylceramidase
MKPTHAVSTLAAVVLLAVAPSAALAAQPVGARYTPAAADTTRPRHCPAPAKRPAKCTTQPSTVAPPTPPVSVTQTSSDLRQALSPRPALRFSARPPAAGVPIILVDDRVAYQRFTGVGGALTDSSAWLVWDELAPSQRAALFSALFSTRGAHLSFMRVPMGASDYSATGVPYTYDDQPAGQTDPTLSGFSVAHDQAYILPALRAARALNPSMYAEALPWSPPGWMKTNDALDNTHGAGALNPADYPALAQYFVRFLTAYAAQGVPIDAITPQNEPAVPTLYPGMAWNQAQEAAFITNNLRPALAAAHLTPDVFAWDLSWGPLSAGTDPSLAQAASGQTSGVAWHCYFGSPTVMVGVHAQAPGSRQIVDECSTGSGDLWATSELLISTLRNWASAVAVWNLALDPQGGPVQLPNSGCGGCTGLVTVDEQTGAYTLTKDFYQLAQLSHFVQPGAVRVSSQHFVGYQLDSNYQTTVTTSLDDVAFRNPDGSMALMAYNNNPSNPITFAVSWHGASVTYTIPPGATTTLAWR